jgi:peptidoglycan/xylan/chitin deacetylase (PgdA/CDA1 family)
MEKIKWPNGSNNAVMITLNLDAALFAKAYYSDADPADADYATMAKYGLEIGLPRILNVMDAYNIKMTAFVPGWVAEHHSDAVRMLVQCGHEIGCRGYAQENLGLLNPRQQEKAIQKGYEAVINVTGIKPRGFRAPFGEITLDTLAIAKRLGFSYSSCLSDDDAPYFIELPDSDETLLEIPVFWSLYDMPYFIFHFSPPIPFGQGRISNYDKVLNNWKWEYDGVSRDGTCYVLQLDPTTAGDPGRIYMLEELFSYIVNKDNAWYATGSEIYTFMTSDNSGTCCVS